MSAAKPRTKHKLKKLKRDKYKAQFFVKNSRRLRPLKKATLFLKGKTIKN